MACFIFIKITMVFLTELEKIILNFPWKHKRPQVDKASEAERTTLEDINTSFLVLLWIHSNKMAGTGAKTETLINRSLDSEKKSHIHSHLIVARVFLKWG